MQNECSKEDKSCGNACSQTRKQVGKIMLGFGVVIVGLAGYIIKEGLLNKFFE